MASDMTSYVMKGFKMKISTLLLAASLSVSLSAMAAIPSQAAPVVVEKVQYNGHQGGHRPPPPPRPHPRPDHREYRDRYEDRNNYRYQYDTRDNRPYWGRGYDYRYTPRGYVGRHPYYDTYGDYRHGQVYRHHRDSRYIIHDYHRYGLPAPRAGYRYYRDDNGNVIMAAIAGGIIGMIIGDALN